jgi:hypothetical protein
MITKHGIPPRLDQLAETSAKLGVGNALPLQFGLQEVSSTFRKGSVRKGYYLENEIPAGRVPAGSFVRSTEVLKGQTFAMKDVFLIGSNVLNLTPSIIFCASFFVTG